MASFGKSGMRKSGAKTWTSVLWVQCTMRDPHIIMLMRLPVSKAANWLFLFAGFGSEARYMQMHFRLQSMNRSVNFGHYDIQL
jgi:hypothetical protein